MRLSRLLAAGTVALVFAGPACSGPRSPASTSSLACASDSGLSSPDWESEAIALGDSLAVWLSGPPGEEFYPGVLQRLRTSPALQSSSHLNSIEGHAFQRVLAQQWRHPDLLPRLAHSLQQEVRARRLTLRDATAAAGGPDDGPTLVAMALAGLPDSLLDYAGARTVLCHEMRRLLPLLEPGLASYYSDLGANTGPFVAEFKMVYDAGPAGRAIIDTILQAAVPYPRLAAFVQRLRKAVERPDTSQARF